MKHALMNQVTESICHVMESMFQFSIEKTGLDENTCLSLEDLFAKEPPYACRIHFSGHLNGSIVLYIPPHFLEKMIQSIDADSTDCSREDFRSGILAETLNMVAGRALTNLDKAAYIKLGIPEIITSSPYELLLDCEAFHSLEGPIAAGLSFDPS